MAVKKLIEVALPLEKINEESAREKSIRHGHPSTLHLWWARRPLAAARAVIWSSLVDDPSSHPEEFPTEEEQNKERERLFRILEDLVVWENSNNKTVLDSAKAEIMKSTGGNPPPLLDPFAGGGAIPLEAQRLGLEAHAHDLNPVAVMINKAMIEIPPRFADKPPVNPRDSAQQSVGAWSGTKGLAADVRYYGEWMRDEAFKRIGHLYPKVKVPDDQGGGEATVIAWIWARTVKCPNPACGCEAPLIKSTIISKSNNISVSISADSHKQIKYTIVSSIDTTDQGTVNRKGSRCILCNTPISFQYIRDESKSKRMNSRLIATVAEGQNGRIYLSADNQQEDTAFEIDSIDVSLGELSYYPGYINPVAYGLTNIEDLFSKRQLNTIITLKNILKELPKKIDEDCKESGKDEISTDYSQAIVTYLTFIIDKFADYSTTICSWNSVGQKMRNTFGLTGMSMSWDYAEVNPFSNSSGCLNNMITWVYKYLNNNTYTSYFKSGKAIQQDAQSYIDLGKVIVSTDPPYYNNVPYACFSDFFYALMRMSLQDIYPDLFKTIQTPKSEELVADPYRYGSKDAAATHFEEGMYKACCQFNKYVTYDYPLTIYYAYKQTDNDTTNNQINSNGWETMLNSIIKADFSITGTWPIRTEKPGRTRDNGANALASSIVLVCRKRPEDAPSTTRRNFINELKRELKPALQKLQSSNIAPVDLAQSAIGPGMAVFSKYKSVLEADGTEMTIRTALQIINQELDLYFNEQDTVLDKESRFCVDLYTQFAFNDVKFGDADTLARAKNTSVDALKNTGVVFAEKGVVRLLGRDEINETKNENILWLLTQQMTREFENGGIQKCAEFIRTASDSACEQAKALAYRLFTIADRKGWNAEAYAYNNLVTSWAAIKDAATRLGSSYEQQHFDD